MLAPTVLVGAVPSLWQTIAQLAEVATLAGNWLVYAGEFWVDEASRFDFNYRTSRAQSNTNFLVLRSADCNDKYLWPMAEPLPIFVND